MNCCSISSGTRRARAMLLVISGTANSDPPAPSSLSSCSHLLNLSSRSSMPRVRTGFWYNFIFAFSICAAWLSNSSESDLHSSRPRSCHLSMRLSTVFPGHLHRKLYSLRLNSLTSIPNLGSMLPKPHVSMVFGVLHDGTFLGAGPLHEVGVRRVFLICSLSCAGARV